MKKFKLLTILLFIFLLTGCYGNNKNVRKNTVIKKDTVKTINIKSHDIPQQKNDTSNNNDISKNNEALNQIKEINGFVLLSSMDKNIVIDLKYATTDNFTKKAVYPDNICVLRKETAEKLVKANSELGKYGYKIKVWDAFRPLSVQKIFFDMVKDTRFVADPYNGGSIHNKGCAVDITLVDKDGNELTMPSKFDDFTYKAYRTNTNIANDAKKNMDLLTSIMVQNGFSTIDTEWWHFEDTNSTNYEIADIDLKQFLNQN